MENVEIELVCEQADASALDEATRALLYDLSNLDGCVVTPSTAPAPPGAKGLDPAEVGKLLLATVGSGGVAVTVISVLRDWLMRHKDCKIRIKRGDIEIEVGGASAQELKALLADVPALLRSDRGV